MKKLKETLPTLFENDDDPRIDQYIDKIRDSLKTTNHLFLANTLFILVFIFSFHLFRKGYTQQFSVFGQNISSSPLIGKWGLVVPSILFMINSFFGYLRIYQKEAIEWLLARHRKKEYDAAVYKLTLPSNHILGLELMTLTEKNKLLFIPGFIIAFTTIFSPVCYIAYHYYILFRTDTPDWQTIAAALACLTCILFGLYTISKSQEI